MSSYTNVLASQLRRFFASNASREGGTRTRAQNARKLKLENLESREMLSVSPVDYQTLQQTYDQLQLTPDYDQVNLIELSELSAQSLQEALNQAAQTEQDDVIVLNTELFANQRLELNDTTITVNVDSLTHGDVYILSYGQERASIAVNETQLSFDVRSGNVFLGGVDFVDIASPKLLYQVSNSLAVDAPQMQFTGQDLGYYSVSGEDLAVLYSPDYYTQIAKNQIRNAFTVKNGLSDNGNVTNSVNSNDYAVLFIGGYDADNLRDYYYDVLVDVYKTLTVNYNIAPQNVYVLYADGDTTGTSINRGSTQTSDMRFATDLGSTVLAANSANLNSTFSTISSKVNSDSHVLLWTYDHGSGEENDPNDYYDYLVGWDSFLLGSTVRDAVYQIKTGYVTCAFGQCFSGGILDDILNPATGQTYSSYNGSAVFCGGAAANHYEVSWTYLGSTTSGYIQAFNDGLRLYSMTDDLFAYAEENNPFLPEEVYENNKGTWVDDAVEHSWHAGANFSIFNSEYESTQWVVTTTEDSYTTPGSLRYCLNNANDGDTITFDESLSGETIYLDYSLNVYADVTIDATNLTDRIIIDGQGLSRGMYIATYGEVNLLGLEFKDCYSTGYGGAIYSYNTTLDVLDCAFNDNYAAYCGSAIYVVNSSDSATTVVNDSSFVNNNGCAAVYVNHNNPTAYGYIASCFFDNNAAGVYLSGNFEDGEFDLYDTVIIGRDGSGNGVTITAKAQDVSLYGCVIDSCYDGIYLSGEATVTVADSVLSNNTFGFYQSNANSEAYISDSSIINNTTGLYQYKGDAVLASSFVQGNIGHGLYLASNASATVYNSVISDNSGAWGGGIELYGNLTLVNSTVTNNHASSAGGGIDLDGNATLNVYNSIIANNTCANTSRNDLYLFSSTAQAYAYNTLSSFTAWTDSSNDYEYDASLPLFVNADAQDYRLATGSQAVNKGDVQYQVSSVDVIQNPRSYGSTIDLGAYEYQGSNDPQSSFYFNELTGSCLVGSPVLVRISPANATATYQWYYASSKSAANWTTIEGATEASYIPTSDLIGKYLKVVVTGVGEYENSPSLAISRAIAARLEAPELTVKSEKTSTNAVTLNWNAVTHIRGYELQYKSSYDYGWTTISDIAKNATSYTITDLDPDTTYQFRVKVTGNNTTYNDSPYSDIVSETTVSSQLSSVTISGDLSVGNAVAASITPEQATVTYQWYAATSPNATTWTKIAGATDASFAPTDARLNKYLKVVVTGTGVYQGQRVEAISDNVVWTKLAPPTLTVDSVDDSSVTLNWNAVDHIRGYQIQYMPTSGSSWSTISDIAKTATSYTVTDLNSNTSYQFRIMVTGNNTYYYDSDYSNAVSATTTSAQLSAVTLSGDLAVGNAVNASITPQNATVTYQWYAATSKTATTWTKIAGATDASFMPTDARLNKYLKVVVTGTGAYQGQSAEAISERVVWTKLVAPTLTVDADQTTENSITLNWNQVTHIRSYQIQYKESSASDWTTISGIATSATSYTVADLTQGVAYDFRIMVTGNNTYYYDSDYSEAVSATTTSAQLSAVTISGDLTVGNAVNASITPQNATVTYQWYAATSKTATTWTKIAGATDASFMPTDARLNKYLKVVVTGTGAYQGQSAEAISERVVWTKLVAPTLTVDADQTTENSITLNWNQVTHIRSYQIQYKESSASDWTTISGIATSATSYTVADLTQGVAYDFRIMVTGNNTYYYDSDYSEAVSATTTSAQLSAVTLSGDLAVGNAVNASITPQNATVTYQWYAATSKTATTWTKIAGATDASFMPTDARLNKYLKVVVTGTGAYQGQSAEAISERVVWTKLVAPTLTVDADQTTENSITLNWNQVTHIRSYQIQYKESSASDWTTISGIATSATSYTVADLTQGVSYDFRIMVTGNNTYYYDSDYSATVTEQTTAHNYELEAIAVYGSYEVDGRVVAVLSDPNATATYQWYRAASATASAGSWSTITSATGSTYTPTTADIGKYLKVVATGSGVYSGSVTAIAPTNVFAVLDAPIINSATSTSTSVALKWSRVAHIRSYQIQYKESSANRWITISDLPTSSTTYTIANLMPDTSYDFRILVTGNNTTYYGSDYSDVFRYQTAQWSNAVLDETFEQFDFDDDFFVEL
ncbi:MAG: fibronectin type III domain-containing protein [Planctomycetia bacterium]|nr:fibronectin type III domain-containing protein [Planctomycetia bacterium]